MYFCPYCDQKSTRRWNLETHIRRRHSGTGLPIPKLPNVPFQSPSNNWLGDFKSKYPNNFFSSSKDDPLDPRNIIEFLRIVSPYLTPGLYGALPMNVGSLDGRTTLGFKGYVCNKCFHYWCKQIFDDEEGISLKSNHTCDPQKLYEAHRYTDITETMHKKRQELISLIMFSYYVFNNLTTQQELLDLAAVEIPSSVFNNFL